MIRSKEVRNIRFALRMCINLMVSKSVLLSNTEQRGSNLYGIHQGQKVPEGISCPEQGTSKCKSLPRE